MHDSLKCHPDCECIECEGEISPRMKAIFWIWSLLIGALFWAGLFWFFMVSTAAAQERPPCAPLPLMREFLKEKYNEVEVGGGLVNEKAVVLLFASPAGETWSLVSTGANGISCLLTEGENWFHEHVAAPGERPA